MPSKNNRDNKSQGTHNHGGVSRGKTKVRRARPEQKGGGGGIQLTVPLTSHLGLNTAAATSSSHQTSLESDLRVLLLGETTFSYAAALALKWGECQKLTVVTDASEQSTIALNPEEVEDNLETVRAFGGTVVFRVDATALRASESVMRRGKKGYERVVMHFPSAPASSTPAPLAVEANQALLRSTLKSVLSSRLLLQPGGEIHVTLRPSEAAKWKVVEIAKLVGLRVRSCSPFDAAQLPGYTLPAGEDAVTYIFVELPPKMDAEAKKKLAVAALAKAHPELRVGPTGQTYKEAWKQRHRKKK